MEWQSGEIRADWRGRERERARETLPMFARTHAARVRVPRKFERLIHLHARLFPEPTPGYTLLAAMRSTNNQKYFSRRANPSLRGRLIFAMKGPRQVQRKAQSLIVNSSESSRRKCPRVKASSTRKQLLPAGETEVSKNNIPMKSSLGGLPWILR